MGLFEIALIVVCTLIVIGVVGAAIRRKVKGKGSGFCSSCYECCNDCPFNAYKADKKDNK